ncbi:Auxin efflux carrier [Corchorus capsularis]|uniref:Auxin efflux carrier n=1 Tax=Corchorus capsularis TaxID=210143 RepID=A0A1R3IWI5_COCAP|nr:Auxin efflux carrier [Corchorus capsularis]
MGFLDLLVVALVPVLKVLMVTGVGLFLAMDHINLLGPETRDRLNKLVFYVFAPALVGTNLAETITYESLFTLWFMPVNIFLTFLIGSALAWLIIKITKTPKHLQGIVIGCCSAGNLGNLPLIIVPAVCKESNSPFGDSSTCSANANAYASLSMAVGAIFIWSYAYPVMHSYAKSCTENDYTIKSCREALLPSSRDSIASEECSGQESGITKKSLERIKMKMRKLKLKEVFAPPTIGAIVGFIIGTVSPIRKVLIGDNAPLRVFDSSTDLLGEPSITCMTLITGANLLRGLKGSEVNPLVIFGIIAVRNMLLPLCGIGVVKAASHFGLVGSDSLYQFILMLQYALPPAMAVGTITQLFQMGQSESSVILLWTYVVAAFFLTLWSTIFIKSFKFNVSSRAAAVLQLFLSFLLPSVLEGKISSETFIHILSFVAWHFSLSYTAKWCPKKKTLDATDEWWNQRIQERPEVKVFKKRGFEPELNELLRCMFGDIVANGKHSLTPSGVLPGGASTEDATPSEVFGDSDEHESLNEAGNENNLDAPNVEQEGQEGQEGQEVQEVVGAGQDKGKRKFSPRKSRGKRMAAQIDKLCDSMSSPRKVIPTAVFSPSRFGVEEAISALRAMQHEVPKMTYLYYFALELFHHQIKREIFLCIQPDERKWWLEREYEKHQAIARYPSFLPSPPSCGFQPFHHIPPPPPGP